jgi:hypothetical protein
MLKIKLTKSEKEKMCNGLYAAAEWICEVAQPLDDSVENGTDIRYEPHIQVMLDAIDQAHDFIAQIKVSSFGKKQ